ncbi:claudin-9-like [Ambystoma mexicanum]|uniref:claudin-9-like n=1 Tax=Ambystoma mexicanum TaxID=8296 RepID=UPI0037E9B03D
MPSTSLEIMGVSFSTVGGLCALLACALPTWKVTAFIGGSIVTAQIIWEGLWMNCIVQSTGQMQCKIYDSMLALPQDLQVARALMVVSIMMAVMGFFVSVIGAKCTKCVGEANTKARIMLVAGVLFILSGLLCLIPVCWIAFLIIQDFYNPLVAEPLKRELGTSLYIGWGGSFMLLLGGGLLCCSCPLPEGNYQQKKGNSPAPAPTMTPPAGLSQRDYV